MPYPDSINKQEAVMGELTNIHGLPQPVVSAVQRFQRRYKEGRGDASFSVTQLLAPPLYSRLVRDHDADMSTDVSDEIWKLLGSSVHRLLEGYGEENRDAVVEQRVTVDFEGTTLTGQADLYADGPRGRVLTDYKLTSTWSVVGGVKPEWVWQLNILNYLFSRSAFGAANNLEIVALFRDWSAGRAKQGGDYPSCGAAVVPVEIKPLEAVETFLRMRIALHKAALEAEDVGGVPVCSREERWCRPGAFAVKKAGGSRAVAGGVHETREAAEEFLARLVKEKPDKYEIESRSVDDVRCKDFCPVAGFCYYGKQYKTEGGA